MHAMLKKSLGKLVEMNSFTLFVFFFFFLFKKKNAFIYPGGNDREAYY